MKAPDNGSNYWRKSVKAMLLFLAVFSCCLLALSLLMTPIRFTHEERIKTELINHHNELLALTEMTFEQRMLQMARDVRFLASLNPLMPEDPTSPVPPNTLLARIFLQLVELNPTYDQIRLITADGQEILRANRTENGARLTNAENLQNKASRYYFAEASLIPPEQVYFSRLDLNIEHGDIEKPLTPVIRVAVKVPDQDHSSGLLLVINFRAESILAHLRELFNVRLGQKSMLLSQEGFWIVAPDRAWEWGGQLGNPDYRLQEYDRELWDSMTEEQTGVIDRQGRVYVFRQVHPFNDVPGTDATTANNPTFWYMLSEIDQIAWRGKSFVEGKAGHLTVLVLIALSAIVALAFTLLIAARLNRPKQ